MTGRSNALDGIVAMREVCEPALVERFGIVLSMAVLDGHVPTDIEARWRTLAHRTDQLADANSNARPRGEARRSPWSQSIDGNRHE